MSAHTPGPWNVYLHEHIVAHEVEAGTSEGACEEYALWMREFGGEHDYMACRSQISAGWITARAAIKKATEA